MDARLVLVSAPSQEEAEKLAGLILEQRLAACITILTQAVSIYWWEGKLQRDDEKMMVIKSKQQCLSELEKMIIANHPYDVPEFLVLTPEHLSDKYYQWLDNNTR